MADGNLTSLIYEIGADPAKLRRGWQQAVQDTEKGSAQIERRVSGMADKATDAFGSAAGAATEYAAAVGLAAAAAKGAAQIFDATLKVIAYAADLDAAAKAAGTTAEKLQIMRIAAQQADVANDQLSNGLERMLVLIGKVKEGTATKKEIGALAQLGLTPEDVARIGDVSDLMVVIAQRIHDVSSEAERAQIAKALGFEKLLPVLKDGASGLAEVEHQARLTGRVMSDEVAAKAHDASDALGKLSGTITDQLINNMVQATGPFSFFVNLMQQMYDKAATFHLSPDLVKWLTLAGTGAPLAGMPSQIDPNSYHGQFNPITGNPEFYYQPPTGPTYTPADNVIHSDGSGFRAHGAIAVPHDQRGTPMDGPASKPTKPGVSGGGRSSAAQRQRGWFLTNGGPDGRGLWIWGYGPDDPNATPMISGGPAGVPTVKAGPDFDEQQRINRENDRRQFGHVSQFMPDVNDLKGSPYFADIWQGHLLSDEDKQRLHDEFAYTIRGGLEAAFHGGIPGLLQWFGQLLTERLMESLADGLAGGLMGATSGQGGIAGAIGGFLSFLLPHAGGIDSTPAGLGRYDEMGGEIKRLPGGTTVIPHDLSMAMLHGGGGGGVTVNVYANDAVLADTVKGWVAEGMGQAVRIANATTPAILSRRMARTYR